MKKIITILALLCALLPARAQYESFFGQESWRYNIDYCITTCYIDEYDPDAFYFCNETYICSFNHGDTVRIGNDYYYKEEFHLPVFLREDTMNGRLYARYSANEADDEYLLCDLSLSVGDTFVLPDGSADWGFYGDRTMVVDSIGYPSGKKVIYLSLCHDNYEIFYSLGHINPADFNISLRFMEGVGSIYGILPSSVFYEKYLGLLLCIHKDDSLYYMTHETLGCEQYNADVPLYPEQSLQIYPNPTDNQVTLEFITEEEISGTAILRDMVGRVCHLFSVNDKRNTLDMSALPHGVYMLTFIDQNNRKNTKKIVKQ